MRWLGLAMFGLGCSQGPVDDTGSEPDPLQEIVDAYVEPAGGGDLPTAIVAAVVTSDSERIIVAGTTEAGGSEMPTETSVFQIGSVTKVLTGLMLAGAIERGDLAFDDYVDDVLLPDVQVGFPITLGQLVTHHSGMPRSYDNPTGPPRNPGLGYGREELDAFLESMELDRDPGSAYGYSNVGVGVLANALMDRYGHDSYDALLEAQLAGPLGLIATHTHEPGAPVDGLVTGYFAQGGGFDPVEPTEMGALAGSGEVLMSAEDALKLLRAILGRDPVPTPGATERALEPLGDSPHGQVGYAWELRDDGVAYKPGATIGFSAHVAVTDRGAVFAMGNRGGTQQVGDLVFELIETL